MRPPTRSPRIVMLLLVASAGVSLSQTPAAPPAPRPDEPRAVMVSLRQVDGDALRRFKREGTNGVALSLVGSPREAVTRGARRVMAAGLGLYYWIEVARDPALADAHPEWMASLQGPHPEWRRHFPKTPQPADGQVVKNYPWVPIRYREAFDAHLRRVEALLKGLPAPRGIFLNDLQAAPSACGCGNTFCRWVPDYGPVRTATELPPDGAARFVAAVRKRAPNAEIIPVWTTECEEHEMAKGAACDGVPCYTGTCWYAWTEQLMPLARESKTLAVLAPYRAFKRDHRRYGAIAGWVRHALASFAEIPPRRRGTAISAGRLIAVLQGWDVSAEERRAQIQRVREAGARGYLVAEMKIEQGWEPRVVAVSQAGPPGVTPSHGHHSGK